ncbi:MAG: SIMPL domain-containing protein [Candidatus Promineifilaceae bacterium]
MNKKLAVIAMGLLAMAGMLVGCATPVEANAANAQEPPNGDKSITVIGQGEALGQPDRAQVTLGVEIFAPTVGEATAQNEETIQAIMAALVEMGVARTDVQTANYGLWAEQKYGDQGPEGIAGYHVTNQLNTTIRDVDQLGPVLEAVIEAGANSIQGVSFSVSDPARLEAEARAAAMADARARAESLAELAGVELGEIRIINEVMSQPGYPLQGMGGVAFDQASEPSFSPGQLRHQMQVQVTFAIN